MNSEILVSVIVRTYNRETLIAKAVNSIRFQTYRNIEIIVVDDLSTDNTRNVLEDLKLCDKRVVVYSNEKEKGSAGALRTGLEKCNGDVICFLDDDDELYQEKIKKDVECFNADKNIDVVVSGVRKELFDKYSSLWIALEFKPSQVFGPCSVVCRKKVFNTVDVKWGNMEWRDLAFEIYKNNFKVFLSCERLYKTNDTPNSLGKHTFKRYKISLENAQRYYQYAQSSGDKEIFMKYLVNRYKSFGNFCLKKGNIFYAQKCFLNAFLLEKRFVNLIPFT